MALDINNKKMSLVLSNDAKPRMKWTQDLHQRFVDAINHLGGAEKATPKSLMRVMGVHGLTLYHLKSHLQKYRLGKGHQSQTYHQNKERGNGENLKCQWADKISIGAQEETDDWQLAQALQMQMDVQKKLHEQLEVQKHLQLRIEAQGKYLQSVFEKAQETLCGYSFCSTKEVERVKVQLSQLVSMVDSGCPSSSSFSVLTEDDDRSMLKHERNKMSLEHNNEYYSVESSPTSSESSKRNEGIPLSIADVDKINKWKRHPTMLSLMEMHPDINNIKSGNRTSNRKRSENGYGLKNFDLNCELDSGCNGVERFSANFN